MKSEPFNPVQLHLLKMFSYAKDERALEEIRKSLTAYFAQRVEEDMDKLCGMKVCGIRIRMRLY